MKTKLLKKIGLLGLSSIAAFTLMTNVKAEEQCEYTNYYFFLAINQSDFEERIDDSDYVSSAYFPGLKGNNIDFSNEAINKGRICLRKTDSDNGDGIDCGSEIWNLTDWFTKYKEIQEKGIPENIDEESESTILTEKETSGKTTRYYRHGSWFGKNRETGELEPRGRGSGTNLIDVSIPDLIKGSYFPESTDINVLLENDYIKATLTRKESVEKWNTAELFTAPGPCETEGCKIEPALYKITYTADCEEQPNYNATIEYFVKDGDGKETKIEKFDDGSPSPYKDTGLDDGYTKTVPSPKVKNCTPDYEKVNIAIDGEDFNWKVVYTCEESSNPKTGIALIITAWVVGFGAIGYSAYYFMNAKKEENVEL